ncbi:MAG: crossover junction endodeoxyribonuclease RuvC [Candidatus Omnitrophica bacterium]|nr:crossover junction endodeoxyribonuclease RuvC [Candidatus Omnitrophota bacterium]
MRILGVDPGLGVTGYGVIESRPSLRLIEAGVIRTKPAEGIARRLAKIYTALSEAITELKPDVLVIEKLYAHAKHPATAILMGHVRGVVCLLSGTRNLPLVSLPSTRVKKAVTGRGHAGKMQVQRMIQQALSLKTLPEPPDVADALAVAVTYSQSIQPKSAR